MSNSDEEVTGMDGALLNSDEKRILAEEFEAWQGTSESSSSRVGSLQQFHDEVWVKSNPSYPSLTIDHHSHGHGHGHGDAHDGGIFHRYDTVLAALKAQPDTLSMTRAIGAYGSLSALLSGAGQFTVFAPSDKAFEALGDISEELLKHHIVNGRLSSAQLHANMTLTSLNQTAIKVDTTEIWFRTVGGARFLRADIYAGNGVLHVIDKVMEHAEPTAAESTENLPTITRRRGGGAVAVAADAMPAAVALYPQKGMPELEPLSLLRRTQAPLPALAPIVSGMNARSFKVHLRSGATASAMPTLSPISSNHSAVPSERTRHTHTLSALHESAPGSQFVAAAAVPKAANFASPLNTDRLDPQMESSLRHATRTLRRSFMNASAGGNENGDVAAFVAQLHIASLAVAMRKPVPELLYGLDTARVKAAAADSEEGDNFVACASIILAAMREYNGASHVTHIIGASVGIQRPVVFISNMKQAWARMVSDAVKTAPLGDPATEYGAVVTAFGNTVSDLIQFKKSLSPAEREYRLNLLGYGAMGIILSTPLGWISFAGNTDRVNHLRAVLHRAVSSSSSPSGTATTGMNISASLLRATSLQGKMVIGFRNFLRSARKLQRESARIHMRDHVQEFVTQALEKYSPAIDDDNRAPHFMSLAAGVYMMATLAENAYALNLNFGLDDQIQYVLTDLLVV